MKLARFLYRGRIRFGVVDGETVRELVGTPFQGIHESGEAFPLGEVDLLPPVFPQKILAVGLNYRDHAEEFGMPIPDEPVLFMKPPSSLLPHGGRIIYPEMSRRVDYEAELALVVSAECRDVSVEEAGKYILGYTCANDVTARDLQAKDGQWTRAKSFDTFCPLGPFIETEADPSDLAVRLYLNGELRQSSRTSAMIFGPAELLSFVSRIMTLYPGDVILTGTPSGVGEMRPGDRVEVEIEGVGRLANTVGTPSAAP
ncbi:MAG: fumarylacetoacetate hydrolase family protein [Candidatus Geothermincolales bacterium]